MIGLSSFYNCPDDRFCGFCGEELPFEKEDREPNEKEWEWQGFCDAVCALLHYINHAKWADDVVHGTSRRTAMKAVREVIRMAKS